MKKSFAVDKRSICFFSGFFLIAFIFWLTSPLSGGGWVLLVISLLINLSAYAVTPQFCVADEKGLTIHYMFFFKEYFEWENIKHIYSTLDSSYVLARSWGVSVYRIETVTREKKPSFMMSNFSKSMKMKRIIKRYWDGE